MFSARRGWIVILFIAIALGVTVAWATTDTFKDSSGVAPTAQHFATGERDAPDDLVADPQATNTTELPIMRRALYGAQTQAVDHKSAGGFGQSKNKAKKVRGDCKTKGLYLLAQTTHVTKLPDGAPGMRVTLVNQTDELLEFNACDGQLSLVQEAQDKHGVWKPIEYAPNSWCGNSYHFVYLGPGYFWEFSTPRYRGTLKTRIRFAVTLADRTKLYSNDFEGSVNLGQFTQKQGHSPTNTMDPYNE